MNLEEKIKIAIKSCDVELYDIVTLKENGNNIFRVYITNKDGVSIEQCSEVTKIISPILDIDEPMQEEYILEVSSPGVERKLKKLKHFAASINEMVKIKLNTLEVIKGKILDVKDDIIIVEDVSDEIFHIKFDDILSASTYINW
jgi:ribosome maturation factor RimP